MLIFWGSPRYWERSVSRISYSRENSLRRLDDYQESEVRRWAQHKPNYDNGKLDDDIYVVQELTRAIHHSRSVYIITENGADTNLQARKKV